MLGGADKLLTAPVNSTGSLSKRPTADRQTPSLLTGVGDRSDWAALWALAAVEASDCRGGCERHRTGRTLLVGASGSERRPIRVRHGRGGLTAEPVQAQAAT